MFKKMFNLSTEAKVGYLFILPATTIIFIFYIVPVIATFLLSFTKWDLISSIRFVGLENYIRLIHDQSFKKALVNTLYFVAGALPVQVIISLVLALIVNEKWFKGKVFFRAVYFLPVLMSFTILSMLWSWIYEPNYGILNYLLSFLNLGPYNFLMNEKLAMPSLIIMAIWRNLGYNMIIFIAGLQSIPETYYEAAVIDGASKFQILRKITLPLLAPTTFFVVVMGIIRSFQLFDQVFIMTDGGPGEATNVLVFYLYRYGFEWFQMGYAAALSWVFFLIVLVFTLAQFKFMKSDV